MAQLPPAHPVMPVHPDVKLKALPFYDRMTEIMKPSTLSKFNVLMFRPQPRLLAGHIFLDPFVLECYNETEKVQPLILMIKFIQLKELQPL